MGKTGRKRRARKKKGANHGQAPQRLSAGYSSSTQH